MIKNKNHIIKMVPFKCNNIFCIYLNVSYVCLTLRRPLGPYATNFMAI